MSYTETTMYIELTRYELTIVQRYFLSKNVTWSFAKVPHWTLDVGTSVEFLCLFYDSVTYIKRAAFLGSIILSSYLAELLKHRIFDSSYLR